MELFNLIKRVKTYLGHPVVEVYVNDDMMQDIIQNCVDEFKANVFRKEIRIYNAQTKIQLDPKEVAYVVRVEEVGFKSNTGGSAIYDLAEFSIFASDYFNLDSDKGLSTYLSARRLMNQYRLIMGNKLDWKYNRDNGELYISNVSSHIHQVSVVLKSYYTLKTIVQDYNSFFVNYVLANVKIVEGRIRSKYENVVPNSPSDGSQLIQEGIQEKAALEEQMRQMYVPYDFGHRI